MLAVAPKVWARDWLTLEGPHRMKLSFIDISRAYFNTRTGDKHPTYVALPLGALTVGVIPVDDSMSISYVWDVPRGRRMAL